MSGVRPSEEPLWSVLNRGLNRAGIDILEILGRCNFPTTSAEAGAFERYYDCAVSGGQDSLSLVILAKLTGLTPRALHVDHGIREGSASEGPLLKEMLRPFDIPVFCYKVKVEPGPNLEERAREMRRRVLPDGVATGHTLDDQAETMIINLLRGAGLKGLSAMEPSYQKPLLGLRRSQTKAICEAIGLEPIVDPSNWDSRFLRNRVRHELLPLMAEVANRDVSSVIVRQSRLFRAEEAYLTSTARRLSRLKPAELKVQDPVLLRRFIRLEIERLCDIRLDQATTERVLNVILGQSRSANLPVGFIFRRRQKKFEILNERGILVSTIGDAE